MLEKKKTVIIVAGEHSGDILGAELMKKLKEMSGSGYQFKGIGGELMINEGLESIADLDDMSVIGLMGAVKKYPFLKKLAKKLVDIANNTPIDFAVLIDYPGFNLRLAKMLKMKNISIVFYVSPQIWAWRFKRIYFIKDHVDLMLTLFLFEQKLYTDYGVNSVFVGHPARPRILEEKARLSKPIIEPNTRIITLMPGSRTSEIHSLFPVMIESAIEIFKDLRSKNQKCKFLVPGINYRCENYLLERIQKAQTENPGLSIEFEYESSVKFISMSEFVIAASGTATLEIAILEKPMIIIYKPGAFTYTIGRMIVRVKHVGIVNVLSKDTTICKEFLQGDANLENVVGESKRLLYDLPYREAMIESIRKIKTEIGDTNPSENAARAILEWKTNFDRKA
jgi:lipid-A-disaccharide synthase